jgi:hypothetical protein
LARKDARQRRLARPYFLHGTLLGAMTLNELYKEYLAALKDYTKQQSETRKLSDGKDQLGFSTQLNAEDAALERYTNARNAYFAALQS